MPVPSCSTNALSPAPAAPRPGGLGAAAPAALGGGHRGLQGPALSKFQKLLTEQAMKQSVRAGGSRGVI